MLTYRNFQNSGDNKESKRAVNLMTYPSPIYRYNLIASAKFNAIAGTRKTIPSVKGGYIYTCTNFDSGGSLLNDDH